MSYKDEKQLLDSKRDSLYINSLKGVEFSQKDKDKVWEKIVAETNKEKNIKHNMFLNFRMAIAVAILLIAITTFTIINTIFNQSTINQNIITLKTGGEVLKIEQVEIERVEVANLKEVFFLDNGKINVSVTPSKEKKHIEIKTVDASIVVKGTIFNVNKDNNGTKVDVIRGKVEVFPFGKGRDSYILEKDMSITIEPFNIWLEKVKSEGVEAYKNQNYSVAEKKLIIYNMNEYSYDIVSILARVSEQKNDYKEAIKYYNIIVERSSGVKKETALLASALLEERVGNIKRTISIFEEYLQNYPDGVFSSEIENRLKKLKNSKK
ncbi:FecR domain-containing protein [bacterium]|nr:FecR domain-containing protein [bacterium]